MSAPHDGRGEIEPTLRPTRSLSSPRPPGRRCRAALVVRVSPIRSSRVRRAFFGSAAFGPARCGVRRSSLSSLTSRRVDIRRRTLLDIESTEPSDAASAVVNGIAPLSRHSRGQCRRSADFEVSVTFPSQPHWVGDLSSFTLFIPVRESAVDTAPVAVASCYSFREQQFSVTVGSATISSLVPTGEMNCHS